jgi:hypothetical protein
MRLEAMIWIAAMSASMCAAQTRSVTICMSNTSGGTLITDAAQSITSRVLDGIGVKIDWRQPNSCPSSPDVIKVQISPDPPPGQRPNALAYASPFEGTSIIVFINRVRARVPLARVSELMGYVLVHEITHILQRIDRHSETGIMKAHWDNADFFDMGQKRLQFTTLDVDLIYAGLDARYARLALAVR